MKLKNLGYLNFSTIAPKCEHSSEVSKAYSIVELLAFVQNLLTACKHL